MKIILDGNKKTLLGIFVVSLIFYVVVYHALFAKNVEFAKYHLFAEQFLKGGSNSERIVDFSPLYLFINIFLHKHFTHATGILLWLQFTAIAASCTLLFSLLRSTFTQVIAFVGTIIFLLNRSVILYTTVNEPEAFLILFLLCFIACVRKKSDMQAILAGLFLGLCLLVRLNFILLAVLTPVIYLVVNGKSLAIRKTILFLIPVALMVMALSLRNYSVTGKLNPVVMNPGTVFFEGNNPNANGQNAVYPPMIDNCIDEFSGESDPAHSLYRIFARKITGKELPVSEVNSFWAGKAGNFIIDNPWFWIKKEGFKLCCFFHTARWHDIASVVTNDLGLQKTMLPEVPFGLISVLCFIGSILSIKEWRNRGILLGALVCQLAVMSVTYSSDRQRVSVIFIVIYFACAAIDFFARRTVPLRLKILMAAGTLVVFPAFYFPTDAIADGLYQRKQFDNAQALVNEAFTARKNGDFKTASEKNIHAYAQIPYFVESRLSGLRFSPESFQKQAVVVAEEEYGNKPSMSQVFDLTTLYLQNGMAKKAQPLVQEMIQKNYRYSRNTGQSSQPYFYAARIKELENVTDSAIFYLKKAIARNPGDPWALAHLAVLTGEKSYKNKIIRYFSDVDAEYFTGMAALDNKRYATAVESFSYVINKIPEYRDGYVYLAIALGGVGRCAEGAEFFAQAMQKRREPVFKEKEIISLFECWVAKEPENLKARYFSATVSADFGLYGEAITILSGLRDLYPDEKSYAQQIAVFESLTNKYE